MKKMHVYHLKRIYMHLHGTILILIYIMSYYIEKVQYWNSMDKQLENLIDMLYW